MSRAPTHDFTAIELLLTTSLDRLPVFPLPNCVLLPGGLLPLHIFEPRYRALAKACLAGNGVMGIARLMPGYGSAVATQPAIYATVGVGQIVCSEELADGRFMLLLRGIGRAAVQHELTMASDGYRQFCCQQLDNVPTVASSQELQRHQELITLCEQISLHLVDAGQQLCELARTPCPGFAADAVAAAITIDADDRQRMLETASVTARLGFAITALHDLLAQIDVSNANLN